jgi:hypothetical protein
MHEVDLKLTVETPMFCGRGGNRSDTFRISELRALLRFTFRALVVSVVPDSARLRQLEDQLFGSAATERNPVAQSPIRFRPAAPLPALTPEVPVELTASGYSAPGDAWSPRWLTVRDNTAGSPLYPVVYLAGQGLTTYERGRRGFVLNRPYVAPGQEVRLVATVPSVEDDFASAQTLAELLFVASRLFGIGSRARRGFGTFRCAGDGYVGNLPTHCGVLSFTESLEIIRQRLSFWAKSDDSSVQDGRAHVPALDERWRFRHLAPSDVVDNGVPIAERNRWSSPQTPVDLLAFSGVQLRQWRAPIERDDGTTPRVTSEYYEYVSDDVAEPFFESAAYGLPASVKHVGSSQSIRRASPLWIRHDADFQSGLRIMVHQLPALFLDRDEVTLTDNTGRVNASAHINELQTVLDDNVFV